MSCCGCLRWENFTRHNMLKFTSVVIALFGVAMFIYSIVALVQLGDDAFFSREIYIILLLFSIGSCLLALMACAGGEEPEKHPNYLFCFWFIATILLIGNITGMILFKTFFNGINGASSNSNDLNSVIEVTAAKQIQDFILSTYTVCCTGCDATIEELLCENDGVNATEVTGKTFCSASIFNNLTEGTVKAAGECFFAEICSAEQLAQQLEDDGVSTGLGLGCYASAKEIPNFSVGEDTCKVFQELEVNNKPLVGNAAKGSCGGGDPKKYVDNVQEYFNNRYYIVMTLLGLLVSTLGIGWIASVLMILFGDPNHR